MMKDSDARAAFLRKRLDDISEGLKEGIRREIKHLEEQGLPIYVAENGKVVDLQKAPRQQPD